MALHIESPPHLEKLLENTTPERVLEALGLVASGEGVAEYLHWDRVRHLDPPGDLTPSEWWLAIKFQRRPLLRSVPLTDGPGRHFVYAMPDRVLQLLHYVDQRCSGEIAMPEVVIADDQARQHYLVNSLMEEAIRSSQLEGATTSRAAAKELIRSGRRPIDRSEMMIINNYKALQFMRGEIGGVLKPQDVLELQRILTDGTLDNPDAAGRLQRADEPRIAVVHRADGRVIHAPPPAEQLPERLQRMCDFANGAGEGVTGFIHPVIRAIVLHFWLAYDHPFEDGNGRTARALFYWSMRTNGYWLTEYLSISRILRKAPSKYVQSFLLTETDDRDTTYFILYQLDVIQRAVEELHTYLRRKVREVREIHSLVRGSGFNHRQLALLSNGVSMTGGTYTFQSHATSHGVTHETARNDLLDLWRRGLLEREKVSKRFVFSPADRLADRLKDLSP